MRMEFFVKGHIILKANADCVPPPGSQVLFEVECDHPRYHWGTEIRAVVSHDKPAVYVFPPQNDPLNRHDALVLVDLEVIDYKDPRDV